MGTEHIVTDTGGDVTLRPCTTDFCQCLVGDGLHGLLHLVAVEPALTLLLHTDEIDGEFQSIATTFTQDRQVATLEIVTGHGPAILPDQRTDSERGTATQFEVSLPVERHHLDALINNEASEVSGTTGALFGSNHHLTTTVIHVTTNIIYIGSLDALRTSYDNIIGGVDTVAAGTVGTEQIIPAITVHQVRGLAVDSDVLLLVTLHAETGLRVEFDKTDRAEIGAIGHPQPTCRGVQEQTWVDGILILHTIGVADLHSLAPLEVG